MSKWLFVLGMFVLPDAAAAQRDGTPLRVSVEIVAGASTDAAPTEDAAVRPVVRGAGGTHQPSPIAEPGIAQPATPTAAGMLRRPTSLNSAWLGTGMSSHAALTVTCEQRRLCEVGGQSGPGQPAVRIIFPDL